MKFHVHDHDSGKVFTGGFLFSLSFIYSLFCLQDNFQFWGDQIPPQAWARSVNSLGEPASAAEHFDGDADDIFFDLTAAREVNEKAQDKEAMDMEPCDMNVSADEALSMEGDLERVRGTVSNQQPTFVISLGPSFGFSFIDSVLQQFAFDPVQDW